MEEKKAESIQDGLLEIWDRIFPDLSGTNLNNEFSKIYKGDDLRKKFEQIFQKLILIAHNDLPEPIYYFSSKMMWFIKKEFWVHSFPEGEALVNKMEKMLYFCQIGAVSVDGSKVFQEMKQACNELKKSEKVNSEILELLSWLEKFSEFNPLILSMVCANFVTKFVKIKYRDLFPLTSHWLLQSMETPKQKITQN